MNTMLKRCTASLGVAIVFLAGCAAGGEDSGGSSALDSGRSDSTSGADTAVSDSGSGSEGGFTVDALADVGTSGDVCAEETKRVYVVSKQKDLYRFDPATLAFTKVGALGCDAGTATPFSMAIDRKGTAWVLYSDGRIFHASTKDASCTVSKYVADQEGWHTFGMAFAADGATSESLYVAEMDKALGRIDTATLKLTPVGAYGKTSVPAELTGRGDGKLFAFFQRTAFSTAGPRISELDPKTGKILGEKNPPGVDVGSGWAFAHWGGSYWLFTASTSSSGTTTSKVTEYDFDANTAKDVVADVGFKIVGAGVSTCAPTSRPK